MNEESKFRLLWVDEEDDEISVSSNEEFSQAIAHLEDQKNSNRLKILIRFQPKSKNLIIPAPEEIFSKRQIEKINQLLNEQLESTQVQTQKVDLAFEVINALREQIEKIQSDQALEYQAVNA